jgi:hypothetical protein
MLGLALHNELEWWHSRGQNAMLMLLRCWPSSATCRWSSSGWIIPGSTPLQTNETHSVVQIQATLCIATHARYLKSSPTWIGRMHMHARSAAYCELHNN